MSVVAGAMDFEHKLTINELSAASGVSARTIKHLIHLKLLPPALGKTRGARYTGEHLERLATINSMRSAGWTVTQMQQELAVMHSPAEAGSGAGVENSLVLERKYKLSEGVFLVFQPAIARVAPTIEKQLVSVVAGALPYNTKDRHQVSARLRTSQAKRAGTKGSRPRK
jgi:DNA-binding transcriptional MerR regulator